MRVKQRTALRYTATCLEIASVGPRCGSRHGRDQEDTGCECRRATWFHDEPLVGGLMLTSIMSCRLGRHLPKQEFAILVG